MSKVLSDYIQWNDMPAKGVVGLHNGGFMRCYKLLPPSLEHAGDVERLAKAERANDGFRRLRDSYGLHFEEQFLPTDGYSPKADWPTRASEWLDAERERDCLAVGAQLEAHQFLSITSKPKGQTNSRLSKWVFASKNKAVRDLDRDLAEFARTCEEVQSALTGAVSMRPLSDNETASYLHFTATHHRQRVIAAQHPDLGMMLGVEPFDPAWGVGKLGKNYVQFVVLSGYDSGTHPQMLEDLDVRFPYRRVTRWLPMERGDSRALLRSRQMDAGMEEEGLREAALKAFDKTHQPRESMRDEGASAAAKSAREASSKLDRRGYGMMSTTFVVWDESKSAAADKAKTLRREIANAGLVAKSETLGTWGTWLGTLPGHLEPGAREVPMTTRHLADLAPSTRKWPGANFDKAMEKKTGVKRAWMYTADPRPFRLTTDVDGGAANVAVFGAVGSGKSTLVNHLCLQFFAWQEAQVISLSVGRSELGPCLLSGGAVYAIGAQKSPLSFQPFAHIDRPEEMRFATEWLEQRIVGAGVTVTHEHRSEMQKSLALLASEKPKQRTISELRKILKTAAPDMYGALQPYSLEGMYGHIFDGNDAGSVAWRRWTMFDISRILDKTVPAWVVESALSLLLHLVQSRFTGQPTVLLCDEYPQYLRHESLRLAISSTLDTQRKNNVRMILAAQNPQQLADHTNLVASVQSACQTRIYGLDVAAKNKVTANAYREWGVTDSKLDAISRLRQGHFLFESPKGTREFNYRPGPIALTLAGMNEPDELKLISSLNEQHKGNPDLILQDLMRARGLELKAKELERWQKTKHVA
jgi:type IV secretory pathway VirB4 component